MKSGSYDLLTNELGITPEVLDIVLEAEDEIRTRFLDLDDIKAYVNKADTLIYNDSEKCSTIEPGYFGGGYNDL